MVKDNVVPFPVEDMLHACPDCESAYFILNCDGTITCADDECGLIVTNLMVVYVEADHPSNPAT